MVDAFLPMMNTHASLAAESDVKSQLLDVESFHRMISLERKRSERSKRLFLLVLLDIRRVLEGDKSGKTLSKVLSAV